MEKLPKIFLTMVAYSIAGIVEGTVLGMTTAFVLSSLYGPHGVREVLSSPMPAAAGALIGGVVSAVLVIKSSKND